MIQRHFSLSQITESPTSSEPEAQSKSTTEDQTISPQPLSLISEKPLQEILMRTGSEQNLSRTRRADHITRSSFTGHSLPPPRKTHWKRLTLPQSEPKSTESYLSLEEESSPTKHIISGRSSQDTPSPKSLNSSTRSIFPSTKLSKGTQTYKGLYKKEEDRQYPSSS